MGVAARRETKRKTGGGARRLWSQGRRRGTPVAIAGEGDVGVGVKVWGGRGRKEMGGRGRWEGRVKVCRE
jgi:hypothetical protein